MIAHAPDLAGHDANTPWAIPLSGWKQILARAWKETATDNIGLISAGVAFYSFLAIVPILGGIVMSYGLVASTETVMKTVIALARVLPEEAAELLGKELTTVVTASATKKGLGLLIALIVSLYGAMNASSAIVTALNIAYEEKEKRGFLALLWLSWLITIAGIVLVMISMMTITAMGYLGSLLPRLPDFVLLLGKTLTYIIMLGAGAAAAASLYRYGPSRRQARWTWLSPGSLLASVLWLIVSVLFSLYVANFGNYDATYGSLGAVVVLLTWLYLSAYVFLVGAELNAEVERQTACDSTKGRPKPLGMRGAVMADTVASSASDEGPVVPRVSPPAEMPVSSATEPEPASRPSDAPRPSHRLKELLAARASARVLRIASVNDSKLALLPSLLTTAGLMMLRKKGREPLGMLLLASGGGLAWLKRERPRVAYSADQTVHGRRPVQGPI